MMRAGRLWASARRRGVSAVTDDQRDTRHDLIVGQVAVEPRVGGRAQPPGVDGGAGGDHCPHRQVRQGVEDGLQRFELAGVVGGAQADQDLRAVAGFGYRPRGLHPEHRTGVAEMGRQAAGSRSARGCDQHEVGGGPEPDRMLSLEPAEDSCRSLAPLGGQVLVEGMHENRSAQPGPVGGVQRAQQQAVDHDQVGRFPADAVQQALAGPAVSEHREDRGRPAQPVRWRGRRPRQSSSVSTRVTAKFGPVEGAGLGPASAPGPPGRYPRSRGSDEPPPAGANAGGGRIRLSAIRSVITTARPVAGQPGAGS